MFFFFFSFLTINSSIDDASFFLYNSTKEKPHSCTECNFKAGDRSSLTRHRKRHQKQRQGYNTQTSVEHKYENLKPDKYVFVHVVSGLEVGPASVAEGMTRVEQLEPVPDSGYASNKDPSARCVAFDPT